jgi:tetratricopeptide (TPR) repeat protein
VWGIPTADRYNLRGPHTVSPSNGKRELLKGGVTFRMSRQRSQRKREQQSRRSAAPGMWRKRLVMGAGVVVAVVGLLAAGPVWQQHRLQQIRVCLRNRNLDQAQQWLDAALQRDPGSGEALLLAGRLHRRQGRLSEARDDLKRAWEAGVARERIEREQWLALAQAGQLDEAEPHLNHLLSDPQGEAAEICEAYLIGYLRAYRFDDALNLLQAWQTDFPLDPQPRIFRGMVFEHLMMTSDAIQEYQAACQLAPDRLDAHLRLANQLVSMQQHEEASAHFRQCVERDPHNVEARLGYASCLMAQGLVDEPEALFQQVLQDAPDNLEAQAGLASLAASAGRYDEAVEVLRKVVERQPSNRKYRYHLATALQTSGHAEEAKPHFEYVTRANKALARVQLLLEQLRTRPDRVDLRYEVGTTLLEYGTASEGVAWLQSVLQRQPDHQPTHVALAEYYESHDAPDLAARHRREAGS